MKIGVDIIYNKDCISGMKSIPNETVDCIVTDPPYLMRYKSGRRKNRSHKFCNEIIGDNDEDLIKNYISESYRILKPNTALYMFCNANNIEKFKIEIEKYFTVKNIIVWVKNNHTSGDLIAQYGKKYEFIIYANKGRCPICGKRISDVWEFPKVSGKNLIHQNQKPVDLIRQCIEKSTDEGCLVFDGFMGSGTTAIAAIDTNRHYLGYELDREYYHILQNRILDHEFGTTKMEDKI